MLKETFIELLTKYSDNHNLKNEFWTEIETAYSDKKRYYHDLSHLENLLAELQKIKSEIKDWNTILFTLFYHDLVYDASKSDNEEQSAIIALKRMKQIAVPQNIMDVCEKQILATKKHLDNSNSDINYFTDADLSILGQSWESYSEYYKNIRKEYAIYQNEIYNPGRKKVLMHFLAMERIFKTEHFYDNLETQAKQNLQRELDLL